MIDYSSYVSIRITKYSRFPILKLTYLDELSIKLVQCKLDVLADLTKVGLPVVEFDRQPILDNRVTYSY